MAAKIKPMRVRGEVPEGYEGPVYHRMMEDLHAPFARRRIFKWNEDEARIGRLYNPGNRGRRVLDSGLVVDGDGQLLPEWRQPLKAQIVTDAIEREEYMVGDPAVRISERMHDAIVSLEPEEHIFIAIDASRPDGTVLRYYLMFMGKATFEGDPPVLHPAANTLERWTYDNGNQAWRKPSWMSRSSDDKYHFGFLDRNVVDGRHLFGGGSLSDNAHFFSPKLFAKIREFGDVFPKLYELVPIGVA